MSKWQEYRLEDVCTKITDGSHHSPKSTESGYPMASVKDMSEYGLNLETSRKISKIDYEKLLLSGCKPLMNDVLIAKDGNSMLETVCVIKSDIECVILSSIAILRPDTNVVNPIFLMYFLKDKKTKHLMLNGYRSGSAIPRMVLKDFKRFPINLPPLPTQRKIASILSSLDDKIENNRKTCEKLEEIAQAIFKRWFVDFEFPNEEGKPYKSSGGKMVESELGLIPEGWRVGTIGEIGELNSKSWNKSNHPKEVEYVDLSGARNGKIQAVSNYLYSDAPSRAKRILSYGDTIWGVVRPNNKSFAFVDRGGLTGSTGFAVITPRNEIFREYIYLCLSSENAIDHFTALADGAAYPAIKPNDVDNYLCIIPSEDGLESFHRIGYSLMEDIINENRQSEILQQTRDALLPKLMGGEISVDDLEG